jgi:hypothetical protein
LERFTVNGDGTITDNLTGLVWLKNANCLKSRYAAFDKEDGDGKVPWRRALKFVQGINRGKYADCGAGRTDWRLPNVNELESLIHAGHTGSADWLKDSDFKKVAAAYWSSTLLAANPEKAWTVKVAAGNTAAKSVSDSCAVWPVREVTRSPAPLWMTGQTDSRNAGDDGDLQEGIQWPSLRFSDNDDGTFGDELTGLTWTGEARTPGPAECGPGEKKTWKEALAFVTCLNESVYLGCTDWRLPNRKEMRTLVNYGAADNAAWLQGEGFSPAIPADPGKCYFWTSSTLADRTDRAWALNIRKGILAPRDKKGSRNRLFVWPVRGGVVTP